MPGREWIVNSWLSQVNETLKVMTNQEFSAKAEPSGSPLSKDWLWWEQPLSVPAYPLYVGASPVAWSELGGNILQSAGLDLVEQGESKSAYLEVIKQSLKALARAISEKFGTPVDCVGGSEGSPEPQEGFSVTFRSADTIFPPLHFLVSQSLLGMIEKPSAISPAASQPITSARDTSMRTPHTPRSSSDILYDVEVPISISFGRTDIPLKDVLKLTMGSVVELNRRPDEPVDIIVNNCVIARGEVVVLEGNYGVRIQEVVSRQQRMSIKDRHPKGASK
jgi:flagellar motor switch protein FliN/FliY